MVTDDYDAIAAEAMVRVILEDAYTPDGVDIWLHSWNNTLDAEPIQLIQNGRAQEVIDHAAWAVEGNG